MTNPIFGCGWFACKDVSSAQAWWNGLKMLNQQAPSESMVLTVAGHIQNRGQSLLLSAWEPGKPPQKWCPEFCEEAAMAFDCVLLWAVNCRLSQRGQEAPPSPAVVAANLIHQIQNRLGEAHSPDLAHALLRLELCRLRLAGQLMTSHGRRGVSGEHCSEELVLALGSVVDLLDGSQPCIAFAGC